MMLMYTFVYWSLVVCSLFVRTEALALDNFFDVPLSSEMWVSIRSGWYLAYFTSGNPMITYATGSATSRRNTGQSLVADGGTVSTASITLHNDRRYAVQAYIETAHAPMFLNMPFDTYVYSHTTYGTVIHTVSATDLDPGDVSAFTFAKLSGNAAFSFDTSALTITYVSPGTSQGQYEVVITVSDGCHTAVSGTATINVLNEAPTFTNLPASIAVPEAQTAQQTLIAIGTADVSGDTVTCSINSVNPTSGTAQFTVTANNLIQQANPNFAYSTAMYYDIRIQCSDGDNTVYSNFQVDIVKNEAPVYTANTAGYLPNQVAVDRTAGTVFTAAATDPEGGAVIYSIQSCVQGTCPFTVSGAVISSNAQLTEDGYDVLVRARDTRSNSIDRYLSVLVSETPLTYNSAATFSNLPAIKYVMENTAAGTYLYRVRAEDKNNGDTLTLSTAGVTPAAFNTYFTFDTATGTISVSTPFDYESGVATTMTLTAQVDDGTDQTTSTFTVQFVDVNETPTLAVGSPGPLATDEGAKDTIFPTASLVVTDVDASDSHTWDLDCGVDTKYFYISNANTRIYLAREYDMDSGLYGNGTCVVTVYDSGRLSATGTVTLTVNNINDHIPRFPEHHYMFLVSTDSAFFAQVANLTATDYDSNNFGSTNGVLTYSFNPTSAGNFFQIDATGILYVRDVSSFAKGANYVFNVIATDSGSSTGTCTVTIIFPAVEIVTVTTTERSFTFGDDYANFVWMMVVCLFIVVLFGAIIFMVWWDPVVHDWVIFKMYRLSEICRRTPVEPRRSVGKLTVTINNKKLENDPDNALPWEMLAKDADIPETNEVQAMVERRQEKEDREYIDFKGLPVFEKGKGARPESPPRKPSREKERQESPKYATLDAASGVDNWAMEESAHDDESDSQSQWGNLQERVVYNPSNSQRALSRVTEVTDPGHQETTEQTNARRSRNTLTDF